MRLLEIHPPRHHEKHHDARGFTLIELMVVVSMIALLLSFSVPLVFKIDELSRDRSGINTFGVAVTAARAYATRKIADLDTTPQAEYSGAAVLVTPFNQLRVISDLQDETMEKAGKSGFGYDTQTSQLESISLPRGVGVAGINRTATGGAGLTLLPPPFVIRFNRHGQLMVETRTTGDADVLRNVVFYDSNLNGTFEAAGRGGGYTPTNTDPAQKAANYDPDAQDISNHWDSGRKDWRMAFDALESVVGVIVYSKADFEDAGGRFPATPPVQGCTGGCGGGAPGINKWMFENGTVLFFSRNTGNILRTKRS